MARRSKARARVGQEAERDLGDQIVNTRKIVVGRSHALTMTTSPS